AGRGGHGDPPKRPTRGWGYGQLGRQARRSSCRGVLVGGRPAAQGRRRLGRRGAGRLAEGGDLGRSTAVPTGRQGTTCEPEVDRPDPHAELSEASPDLHLESYVWRLRDH